MLIAFTTSSGAPNPPLPLPVSKKLNSNESDANVCNDYCLGKRFASWDTRSFICSCRTSTSGFDRLLGRASSNPDKAATGLQDGRTLDWSAHVDSSVARKLPRMNAIVLGESLASEDADLILPSDDFSSRAHVSSYQQYLEMYKRSIEDPAGFWSDIASSEFFWKEKWHQQVYSENLDVRKGEIKIEWFRGGITNICYNCLDRNIEVGLGERIALYWEGNEPGFEATLTYTELLHKVCQVANFLKDNGVRKGDAVVIYMPMLMELLISMLACARIGAIHSVVFAEFSSESLAQRIVDCKPKIVITCNAVKRGSEIVHLKGIVDAALTESSQNEVSVETCLIYENESVLKREFTKWKEGRDIWWQDVVPTYSTASTIEWVDADDPLFLLYTSGSTGKPKGVLHTTGGYMVYTATTFKYAFDYKPSDIYWCTADCGWITGHSYVTYGPLLNGASVVVYEGSPTYPDPGRCWDIVDKYKVTIFYTAPTLVRSLMREGNEIGAFATPDKIHSSPGLPKTRSGKIMRRILRKIASRQSDEHVDISRLNQKCKNCKQVKEIHAKIIHRGLSNDQFLIKKLIHLYSSHGKLTYVILLFDRIQNPCTFTWNLIIRANTINGRSDQALLLYHQMVCQGIAADKFTFPFVLKACTFSFALTLGKAVHGSAIKSGFSADIYVQNNLIDLYFKCGKKHCSFKVFEKMTSRNVVSWTTMISGLVACGELQAARSIFDQMPSKNVVSWTAMINGYIRSQQPEKALELFRRMQAENVRPNEYTMVNLIKACTEMGSLNLGRWIHDYAIENGFEIDVYLGTALIDMYSKCGSLKDAIQVFEKMPERSLATWNSMITSLGVHGFGEEALKIFGRMERQNVKPDAITFIGVLCACIHTKNVEEGCTYFKRMIEHYGITPIVEHYNCMAELLDEACE